MTVEYKGETVEAEPGMLLWPDSGGRRTLVAGEEGVAYPPSSWEDRGDWPVVVTITGKKVRGNCRGLFVRVRIEFTGRSWLDGHGELYINRR